jgi:hypothetical protein
MQYSDALKDHYSGGDPNMAAELARVKMVLEANSKELVVFKKDAAAKEKAMEAQLKKEVQKGKASEGHESLGGKASQSP